MEKKMVSVWIETDKYKKLVEYAKKNAQGNMSYALRLAIELLLKK